MSESEKLVMVWETDLRIICHSHYAAAVRAAKRNYYLGIPSIVLTALVGTSIFYAIDKSPNLYLQITAGMLSMVAVVLSSLQTFLKWSERAEKHREAGAKFGALLKELENKRAFVTNFSNLEEWSHDFRKRWDAVSLDSPTVPEKLWNQKLKEEKARLERKLTQATAVN